MIEVRGLTKAFGLRPVLRGVDLSVGPGEFVALFGPNGAGKTTLLRILATLTRPTSGRALIAGYDIARHPAAARAVLGLVSHQPLLYGDLTAEQNLHFFGRMYALDRRTRQARTSDLLERVGLAARARDPVRTFSHGMQQRLAIARAVLHDPPVLLLDEPYAGLDQDAALMLDGVLRDVATRGRAVLMTTHSPSRGLAMADRVAILSRGVVAHVAPRHQLDEAGFDALYAQLVGGR
jgi:heme exporter protein A